MKAEWTNNDSLSIDSTGQKEILVINIPKLYDGRHLCNKCPIWNNEHMFCQYDFNMKVKGCPLRPLPKKKIPNGSDIFNDYVRGYNECIDDLNGETE